MAKITNNKAPVVQVGAGETDDDTVIEGEVLTGESYEQFTGQLVDTIEGCDNLIVQVVSHSKEGRRLLFVTASSICVTALAQGQKAMPLVQKFFAALGDDGKNQYRTNSFRKFFETVGPFVWDTNRMVKEGDKEVKKPGLVLHDKRRADQSIARSKDKAAFDSGLMKKAPWQIAGREAGYVPIDVPSALALLAKRARKNVSADHITKTKATAQDVADNNLDLLDQVEELLLRYNQARAKAPAQVHAEHATQQ